ncbi:unnamed protein product [Closterium sp. Naga37s-1]|nr:unnamed protein product [Closterium sp. Naga37s-1]
MREMDAQLQQQLVKVQRIEKGLQSLATFHSTQLLKGFTTLDLSALPSPSYHTLLFHLLSLSLHHSASLSTVSTLKAFPSITNPCLQQTIVLQLPSLRKLDFSNCTRLVDSDLPLIARLSQLTHLCLAGCTGFRFGAAAPHPVISSAPNLANLTDLANLTNLASLTNLANLANLTNLTNLRRLNLSRTAVGDEGMAVWCQLTGITTLDLRHCARVTCRSMYHIRQLQHLHTLNLAWVIYSAVTSTANSAADSAPDERALGPMEELSWLSLFGWQLRDEGALCVAKFFPNLRALRCSAAAGGGAAGGSAGAVGGGLTKGGVKKMVKRLARLGELWLVGGLEEVRKAMRKDRPWLKVLC